MTQLTGTGLRADDLYLLAHHDVTGKPFVQPRALGLGLAGGLLAELVLSGRVRVLPRLAVADRTLPHDELACSVVGLLLGEREGHQAGDWLAFLSRTAVQSVAIRLAQAGYLISDQRQRRWQAGRWVPVDPDWAFAPMIRVRVALDPARSASASDVALAGLAVACGLGFRLDLYHAWAGRPIQDAVAVLGPGLQELVALTQTAVDSAVLSHRT